MNQKKSTKKPIKKSAKKPVKKSTKKVSEVAYFVVNNLNEVVYGPVSRTSARRYAMDVYGERAVKGTITWEK